MIKNLCYQDINQHDELLITVDKFSKEVLYENEKWLSNNERAFVTIFSDGFVSYGLELQEDPVHNNTKYTWSSNADFINECFGLLNTPNEIASWHVAAKEECSPYSCFFEKDMLLSTALLIAYNNQDKLHYGFDAFKSKNQHNNW